MSHELVLVLADRQDGVLQTRLKSVETNLVLNQGSPATLRQIGQRALDIFEQIADGWTGTALAGPLNQYVNFVRTGRTIEEVPDIGRLQSQILTDMFITVNPDLLVAVRPLSDPVPLEVGQRDGQLLIVEIQQVTFMEVPLPKRELHPEARRRLTDPLVVIPQWADRAFVMALAQHRRIFASQMLSGTIDLGVLNESVKSQREVWRNFIRRSLSLDLKAQLPGLHDLVWLTTFSGFLAAAMAKAKS